MKKQHISLVLIAVGLVLVFLGYNEANSTISRISTTLSGSYSNKVLFYYIAGGACAVLGVFSLLKKA